MNNCCRAFGPPVQYDAHITLQQQGGKAFVVIVCTTCGRASHNRHDIEERYCGNCHRFHAHVLDETRR
jgi:hypothetical protein